ncbi:MAG TPA: amylo-alpha-1,6-glucosidase [Gemmatimonadaceae bacterium]|nr:amylo-alpha-1,6-glucosidase [Gemmatimonadaceae bacterium]
MTRRLLDSVRRELSLPPDSGARAGVLSDTEWLVTNGLGGYASSSVSCGNTRRYHGLLVAALPNPYGRMVMLSQLDEVVTGATGTRVELGDPAVNAESTTSFGLDAGLPVWELECDGVRIEKRIWMAYGQNTVFVEYRLVEGRSATIELQPAMHFRGYEEAVDAARDRIGYRVEDADGIQCVGSDHPLPPLRMHVEGSALTFMPDARTKTELEFPVESARGFMERGLVWSPGIYRGELRADSPVVFVASTERRDVMLALSADESRLCELERRRRIVRAADPRLHDKTGVELVLAADQFIVTPAGRLVDATRARAMGDEIRTVIAGYHWFTDWGRDTMISLEGLTLVTGRHREAAFILRTFAHYVKDGLIPNMFPDGSNQGLYHTADATLWFFHALERYRQTTGDEDLLVELLPVMHSIIAAHEEGTSFGIRMDPNDGLLCQGAEGYQLTWMDAKVDGWVVTPRRGKAVEINALWYNALCNTARWTEMVRGIGTGSHYATLGARVHESFNRRFWNSQRGFLYDVIDGDEAESELCRPNQLFAVALENPVLARERWGAVLEVAREKLLTPVGLRSLAPGEPGYKERYFGDLRTRDAAYHQGTVWGWLIGPFVDAWLRLHPGDRVGARRMLEGFMSHLDDFGIGSVAEIFDATEPYTARGCIAQAWSVAELARCWAMTADPTSRSASGAT